MRNLTSLAVVAAALLVLGASHASAVSSIDLALLQGGTGGAPCTNGTETVDCTHTVQSDTIRFAIVMAVDSAGMSSYSFDLRWDEDGENELDLLMLRTRFGLNFGALNYIVGGPSSTQESTLGNGGYAYSIEGVSATVSPPFASSVSFRIGVVSFHVNGNVNKNAGADVEVGDFRPSVPCDVPPQFCGRIFDATGSAVTPNFGSFAIDSVPEPGPSVFMGMGILGLILIRLATRAN